MSRHPYFILEDILKHGRRFLGGETQLIERPPVGPYPFFQPLCQIEEGLAASGHWLKHFYLEYRIRLSELSTNPFPIPVRREIDRLPEMVETRFQNWGWSYALTPDGMHEVRERIRAHRESTYLPLLDAALSWRLGKSVERHEAADHLAGEAEALGVKPTMTPEEGEKVIWDRHAVWFTTPALAESTPTLSHKEHGELGQAVDDLERPFRRLESPEKLKEYAEALEQEIEQTPYELTHLGYRPECATQGEALNVASAPSARGVTAEYLPSIGVITALPHESAAIRTGLDHPSRLDVPGTGAGRIYWIAGIPSPRGGLHQVVIAQAGMGTNVASVRASLLLSHFPSVRSIIMCGIAGGIPNPTKPDDHVRMGDIVVSNLKGVVQYDFIKRTVKKRRSDVPEEVRAAPHRPSAELLEAVETLVADEHLGQRPWDRWLDEGLSRLGWTRPDPATDVLEGPSGLISHPNDPKRHTGRPRVFLGPVASANTLLKDPIKRDALRDRFGVKAVEMEGAGIADATWTHGTGYLVVRGICDYADANKNDVWQNYAAMSAAAYVRALLESMPGDPPRKV